MILQEVVEAHLYRLSAGSCTCGDWSEEEFPGTTHAQHLVNMIEQQGLVVHIETRLVEALVLPDEDEFYNMAYSAMEHHQVDQDDCGQQSFRCVNETHMAREMARQVHASLEDHITRLPRAEVTLPAE